LKREGESFAPSDLDRIPWGMFEVGGKQIHLEGPDGNPIELFEPAR
jgi:hypothetical protein